MSGEIFAQVIGLAAVFIFFGYLVYLVFSFFAHSIRRGRDEAVLAFQSKVNGSLKDEYEMYLASKFAYYDKLSDKLKVKFLIRVRNFVDSKEFYGRGELQVTDEMKVLIGASAVQLTFGLEKYLYDHFDKIFIYPESYYSSKDDNYHMGETHAAGAIVFSWKDFKEGYDITNDAFNVGLHEMAHALSLEQRLGGDYDFYFANYFLKWSYITKEEFQNVSTNERESFLRDYAGTNRQEFFAVCVEYFFEKSEEFKSHLPQIYYHLCALLNQDPLATDGIVKEENSPDYLVLLGEVQSSSPVFTSEYSVPHAASSLFLILLFSVFTLANIYKDGSPSAFTLWAFVFLATFLGILYFRLNRFLLYEKYLVVKNVFGVVRRIYPLSKIVSVSMLSGRNNYVKILIPSAGKMETFTHTSYMDEDDGQKMVKLLKERDVLARA